MEKVKAIMDKGFCFLDMRKAFDTVIYVVLLNKLKGFNFSDDFRQHRGKYDRFITG